MKYGCHNREQFVNSHVVHNGYSKNFDSTLVIMTQWIYNPMAKDCQYTLTELGKVDVKCDGCKHKKA